MLKRKWNWLPRTLSPGQLLKHTWSEPEDLFSDDGISIVLSRELTSACKIEITLFPQQNGRPEWIQKTKAAITIPAGCIQIDIPFELFDSPQLVQAHRKYIESIELLSPENAPVIEIQAAGPMEKGNICLSVKRSACRAQAGKAMKWQAVIGNGLPIPQQIEIHALKYGKEVLTFSFPDSFVLAPYEFRSIEFISVMEEALPKGGYEERKFLIMSNGHEARSLTLWAARERSEPFLLHTEAEWARLRQAIMTDQKLQAVYTEKYQETAEKWSPGKPSQNPHYVYPFDDCQKLLKTAISWKITGKEAFLSKVLQWMQGFTDDQDGYLNTQYCYYEFPKTIEENPEGKYLTHHATPNGWVQEAIFMANLAYAYDLCRFEAAPELREKMEECALDYIQFVHWRIQDGDGNNFQISEAGAGLTWALILQDEGWIRRFLAGTNGLYDLIGRTFSDDGSYFEGATNYMVLVAEELGHAAIACYHGGYSLKDAIVPAAYDPFLMHSGWSMCRQTQADGKPFLGMSFERFLPTTQPSRKLKDFYDNLLQLADEKGILLSANDSNERNICILMQMAFYLYHDSAYLPLALQAKEPDFLFGLHMLPLGMTQKEKGSLLNYGNGFAMLRRNGIQAVLKFGQHGGYHGHYDRLSLVSLIRDGMTFHPNEYTWYGYGSFLFKMWVQTSMAHNMVVVDDRMQEPTPCQVLLFEKQGEIQAVCAQTTARWSDPPYGGQTPYLLKFPEEKCPNEKRYILPPPVPRKQGEIGEYSEPVFQRRLLILVDGSCVIADYLEAEQEHTFDYLCHPMGKVTNDLPKCLAHHPRLSSDPFNAGQFILDCYQYPLEKGLALHFQNSFQRENYANDAVLTYPAHTVLMAVGQPKQELLIGRYPTGKDRFETEYPENEAKLLENQCKKTVVIRQRGKKAFFLTALEISETETQITKLEARSDDTICIQWADNHERRLKLEHIQNRSSKAVKVYEL